MTAVLLGAGLVLLLGVAAAVAVLRGRVVVIRVSGLSMAPALRPGDRLLVRRTRGALPRVGQVVVFRVSGPCRPDDPTGARSTQWLVKRVVAVPGDPSPPYPGAARWSAGVIPPGHLVVVGDNAGRSHDSRHFGAIQADRVLGVAVRQLGGGSHRPGTGW